MKELKDTDIESYNEIKGSTEEFQKINARIIYPTQYAA